MRPNLDVTVIAENLQSVGLRGPDQQEPWQVRLVFGKFIDGPLTSHLLVFDTFTEGGMVPSGNSMHRICIAHLIKTVGLFVKGLFVREGACSFNTKKPLSQMARTSGPRQRPATMATRLLSVY